MMTTPEAADLLQVRQRFLDGVLRHRRVGQKGPDPFSRRVQAQAADLPGYLLNLTSNGLPLSGPLLPPVVSVAMKDLPVQARKQQMDVLCRLPGSERKGLEARRRRLF
jgi:hypothetical protein